MWVSPLFRWGPRRPLTAQLILFPTKLYRSREAYGACQGHSCCGPLRFSQCVHLDGERPSRIISFFSEIQVARWLFWRILGLFMIRREIDNNSNFERIFQIFFAIEMIFQFEKLDHFDVNNVSNSENIIVMSKIGKFGF